MHLVEEAFGIPVGTFDAFFSQSSLSDAAGQIAPQHRIKLVKYPPSPPASDGSTQRGQGVGPHKDSSGWLTFLYQVGREEGLEVLTADGKWISASPIKDTFVVNFGNAFEAATEGAVKATTHRVTVCFHTEHPHLLLAYLPKGSKVFFVSTILDPILPGTPA